MSSASVLGEIIGPGEVLTACATLEGLFLGVATVSVALQMILVPEGSAAIDTPEVCLGVRHGPLGCLDPLLSFSSSLLSFSS